MLKLSGQLTRRWEVGQGCHLPRSYSGVIFTIVISFARQGFPLQLHQALDPLIIAIDRYFKMSATVLGLPGRYDHLQALDNPTNCVLACKITTVLDL